jgi:hypothetical protein
MKHTFNLAALILAFAASNLFAGGWFIISLGQPGANSDPRAHTSAFVVRVYGCSARTAEITATAEGLVNGRRQSITLQPVRLAGGRETVLFSGDSRMVEDWPSYSAAIPWNWPSEGTWIIRVVASTSWHSESAFVVLGPDGIDRARTRQQETVPVGELEVALRTLDADNARVQAAAIK